MTIKNQQTSLRAWREQRTAPVVAMQCSRTQDTLAIARSAVARGLSPVSAARALLCLPRVRILRARNEAGR